MEEEGLQTSDAEQRERVRTVVFQQRGVVSHVCCTKSAPVGFARQSVMDSEGLAGGRTYIHVRGRLPSWVDGSASRPPGGRGRAAVVASMKRARFE